VEGTQEPRHRLPREREEASLVAGPRRSRLLHDQVRRSAPCDLAYLSQSLLWPATLPLQRRRGRLARKNRTLAAKGRRGLFRGRKRGRRCTAIRDARCVRFPLDPTCVLMPPAPDPSPYGTERAACRAHRHPASTFLLRNRGNQATFPKSLMRKDAHSRMFAVDVGRKADPPTPPCNAISLSTNSAPTRPPTA
jgi:hypothetical protein